MQEIWKDIKGFEGLYQISSLGRVKSFRVAKNRNYYGTPFHFLKPSIINSGYRNVTLYKNSKCKQKFLVHKLVAEAFIPNPNNYPCVNHKDENKLNNRVDNLEWCSYQYNNAYGTAKIRQIKTSSLPVAQYTLSGEMIAIYASIGIASTLLGFNKTSIKDCCNGKEPYAFGYIWKHINTDIMSTNNKLELHSLSSTHHNNYHQQQ